MILQMMIQVKMKSQQRNQLPRLNQLRLKLPRRPQLKLLPRKTTVMKIVQIQTQKKILKLSHKPERTQM